MWGVAQHLFFRLKWAWFLGVWSYSRLARAPGLLLPLHLTLCFAIARAPVTDGKAIMEIIVSVAVMAITLFSFKLARELA